MLLQSKQLESEEKNSPASSEASVNRVPVDPFQDSMDPYNGYNLDNDWDILKVLQDNLYSLVTIHQQYPHPAKHQTEDYSSTAPVTVHEHYSRKARGQVTIHKQYQSLFIK